MHWQYWPLQVNVPKNTPASAPVQSSYPITQGHLRRIEILVPAGHHGQTGIRIVYQGVQIYPWSITKSWLIDSGNLRVVNWDDEIQATGLRVDAYNTDLTAHSFYLLAEVLPVVTPAPGAEATDLSPATVSAVRRRVTVLKSHPKAA